MYSSGANCSVSPGIMDGTSQSKRLLNGDTGQRVARHTLDLGMRGLWNEMYTAHIGTDCPRALSTIYRHIVTLRADQPSTWTNVAMKYN